MTLDESAKEILKENESRTQKKNVQNSEDRI
jgi:hypothetical protein